MKSKEIQNVMKAWQEVMEKKTLDPVDKKALNKDFDDREDKDIDNDGDTDSSDEYLHNRRKAVSKAMSKGKGTKGQVDNTSVNEEDKAIKKVVKLKGFGPDAGKSNMSNPAARASLMRKSMKKESVELGEAFKKGDSVTVKNARKYDSLAKPTVSGKVIGMNGLKVMVQVGTGQMNVDVKDLMKESVELDELSNDTLGSYAKKNIKSALKGTMPNNRSAQRTTGINRALDKMRKKDQYKEEVELGEGKISRKFHKAMTWSKDYTGSPKDMADVMEQKIKEAAKKYSASLTDLEYQQIRKASMRGLFSHKFKRVNDTVTFLTNSPNKLASDLEKIIDSGETSWNEILGIHENRDFDMNEKQPALESFGYMNGLKVMVQVGTGQMNVDVKDLMKESVELDELSKKTLGSYIQKAVDTKSKRSVANLASKGAHKLATSDGDDDGEKEDRKAFRRSKGIATAAKKLTREEFDCAKQVASEQWGFGECIPGQYSLVEYTDGSVEITHYDVMFEHGIEFDVPVEELTVLMSESYEYVTESEELDESTSVSEFEEVVVDAYQERSKGMRGALERMWEAAAQAKTGVEGKYQETMKSKFKGKGANDMAKDADMDNPELVADDEKGHVDATKAGRVTKQSPTRGGEKRIGDKGIVNPVQGAVTKTTGKE